MTNYFELYKAILSTINDSLPETGHELIDALSDNKYILQEKERNTSLMKETLLTLDNLISDGLINAKRTNSKGIILYQLSGLTTLGQGYLLEVSDKSFPLKLKEYLKENGIPMTPQSITRCIAYLIFK